MTYDREEFDERFDVLREIAEHTLGGLGFYIQALEQLVDDRESLAVDSLRERFIKLAPEQQTDFWEWNFPFHWDEIVRTRLRFSFVVTLVSFAELQARGIARQVEYMTESQLRPMDLRGGELERCRKYLGVVGGFQCKGPDVWSLLFEIRDIRNCLVHADGRMWEMSRRDRMRQLADNLPGFTLSSMETIEIGPEFPIYALGLVKDFTAWLYDEASGFVARSAAQQAYPPR